MSNELYLSDEDLALYMKSEAFRDMMVKSVIKVGTTNQVLLKEWVTPNLIAETAKIVWLYIYIK
jgi:hypothetical protein